jgi:hypothetical protein
MLSNYISIKLFIISFAIGIFFVYVVGPNKKIIYIYPTPENVEQVLFKDVTDSCFYFKPTEVDCPRDKSMINDIPIQTSE